MSLIVDVPISPDVIREGSTGLVKNTKEGQKILFYHDLISFNGPSLIHEGEMDVKNM